MGLVSKNNVPNGDIYIHDEGITGPFPTEPEDGEEGHQGTQVEDQGEQQTPSSVHMFKETPQEQEDETRTSFWVFCALKLLKVLAYLLTFSLVLGGAVVTRGTLLFMTSQLKIPPTSPFLNSTRKICKDGLSLEEDKLYSTGVDSVQRVAWKWMLLLVLCVPELICFLDCVKECMLRSIKMPGPKTFFLVFVVETFHATGLCLLVFAVLPEMDAVKGAMICNCVAIVPALLASLSHKRAHWQTALNILAFAGQVTGTVIWTLGPTGVLTLPAALVLVSFAWWETAANEDAPAFQMLRLAPCKRSLEECRSVVFLLMSIWKMIVLFLGMLTIEYFSTGSVVALFDQLYTSFGSHQVPVYQLRTFVEGTEVAGPALLCEEDFLLSRRGVSLIVAGIHIAAGYIGYRACVFACRIDIQAVSMAFPLSLAGPATMALIVIACGARGVDVCFFNDFLPKYLFWNCPNDPLITFITNEQAWFWLLWFLGQVWITGYIWTSHNTRMAAEEAIFARPSYCSALLEQSTALNLRNSYSKLPEEAFSPSRKTSAASSTIHSFVDDLNERDDVTRIYACATMWHETKEEMLQLVKSMLRVDFDQIARRSSRAYHLWTEKEPYLFEANIFFDDAFQDFTDASGRKGRVINDYVRTLVATVEEAVRIVYRDDSLVLDDPLLFDTPYGGRVEWIMPGHNKLVAHFKDKTKIRHKKRWSQVMYMYYLLGHRLMEMDISVERKDIRKQNTYILALDGDINFKPEAIFYLLDLMKNNSQLGAVCGRIHPVGSGAMVWYQKFEYAVGHWLQKATEHVLGCVLCSPGCFSLFRGEAIMADNVMRTYTTKSEEARHFVQYDQGEDRWLCTLLLKQGYQVEYSAASDAYTRCPESFEEFFTQRRRWTPSTMANILDLLMDAKQIANKNQGISMLYMTYQTMLMIGTILGPGTIFLMLLGSFVSCFRVSNVTALLYNIVPVMGFTIVCFTCSQKVQIFVAQILSAAYALLMTAVVVGIALQIQEDGIASPSSIFLVATVCSFLLAALFHPREFGCIIHGLLYFVLVPSMYLLLILYSIVNLNVVSWGTREGTQTETAATDQKVQGTSQMAAAIDSVTTCSLGNIVTCFWCTSPKKESPGGSFRRRSQRDYPASSLQRWPGRRMPPVDEQDEEESPVDEADSLPPHNANQDPADIDPTTPNPQDPTHWCSDAVFKNAPQYSMGNRETEFWKQLINQYLKPEDTGSEAEKKRVEEGLKSLRNRTVSTMLLCNALYVLTILLLQYHKNRLYINWPIGETYVVRYFHVTGHVTVEHQAQRLEPIGLVFLVFFALILTLQLCGMLTHRFQTLSHVLAATLLLEPYKKRLEDQDSVDMLKRMLKPHEKPLQDDQVVDTFNLERPTQGDNARQKSVKKVEASTLIKRGLRQGTRKMDLQSALKHMLETAEDNASRQQDSISTSSRPLGPYDIATVLVQRTNSARRDNQSRRSSSKSSRSAAQRTTSRGKNRPERPQLRSVLSMEEARTEGPNIRRSVSTPGATRYKANHFGEANV
ncbi:chitin synthase chs-2 isoform X3 [Ixodes scapularis]|nr:chitin synthase chs-2 isoform X3 [Ixodes scapularis]XP_040078933.1 chitin synthase chs-2 isoform X3 [Ixodes scapularis]